VRALRVLHRRSRRRCVVCHDERGPLSECGECEATFHKDCRDASARCPTLGCVGIRRRPVAWTRERDHREWPVGLLFVGTLLWAAELAAVSPNHPEPFQQLSLWATAIYAFFFLARIVVAAIRRERGTAWRVHAALLITAPAWSALLGTLLLQGR
jgi:hypothetical protein